MNEDIVRIKILKQLCFVEIPVVNGVVDLQQDTNEVAIVYEAKSSDKDKKTTINKWQNTFSCKDKI